MYDTSQINAMDYRQLRDTVQELYDSYVKLKRVVEDRLDNIDESNLASTFQKKLNNYESKLSITAEKIESTVSYEDLKNNLKQYSTIAQTAKEISMSVNQVKEYSDSQTEELSSTFTMTAERISTNVVKLDRKVDGNYTKLYSSIEQTAKSINMIVGKEYDTSKATSVSSFPPADSVNKDELIRYSNKYYYYNDIAKEWIEYDSKAESAFTQTKDGFILNGCVEVQGKINMTKDAVIGKNLILQDQDSSTTGWGEGLSISVNSGTASIAGKGSRSLFLSGGYITLVGGGKRLIIDNDGLTFNGARVLTTKDLPSNV